MDERLNFGAATDAALTYLEQLHRLFHNWPLALAAYNAGEGRVQKAIAVQGVNNFYHLSLPEETERYILPHPGGQDHRGGPGPLRLRHS